METALSVFALILPLSISALVLAHLVSLLSSLFRVAFATLLLFGLVGTTVLSVRSPMEKKVVDTRCRQLQRQLHWIGHLDQW